MGYSERSYGKVQSCGASTIYLGHSLQEYPMGDASHPERKADGVDGRTVFSEGVLVGYRWFDKQNIQPLYPFGFGLSHTKFAYSKIKLAHADDGGEEVSFVLQNNGARDGHEVPQVYAMVRSGSPMTVLNSRYGHWQLSTGCISRAENQNPLLSI
jgi:beta-glucosidase